MENTFLARSFIYCSREDMKYSAGSNHADYIMINLPEKKMEYHNEVCFARFDSHVYNPYTHLISLIRKPDDDNSFMLPLFDYDSILEDMQTNFTAFNISKLENDRHYGYIFEKLYEHSPVIDLILFSAILSMLRYIDSEYHNRVKRIFTDEYDKEIKFKYNPNNKIQTFDDILVSGLSTHDGYGGHGVHDRAAETFFVLGTCLANSYARVLRKGVKLDIINNPKFKQTIHKELFSGREDEDYVYWKGQTPNFNAFIKAIKSCGG